MEPLWLQVGLRVDYQHCIFVSQVCCFVDGGPPTLHLCVSYWFYIVAGQPQCRCHRVWDGGESGY